MFSSLIRFEIARSITEKVRKVSQHEGGHRAVRRAKITGDHRRSP